MGPLNDARRHPHSNCTKGGARPNPGSRHCGGPQAWAPTTSHVQAAVQETGKGGGGGAADEQTLRSARSVLARSGRTWEHRRARKVWEAVALSSARGHTPAAPVHPGPQVRDASGNRHPHCGGLQLPLRR
ncbi:hypothetical protein NDU88_003434 [Pleurodeles waltl]|uniref:Uncharacterized protein n=1 Tax=Pleurodeles waltl TaxID=8319 RepID=A0AAV7LFC3_PLEWA|nr:hypothetical protein NDU88_003434 [Pleurodeles waltl]